MHAEAFEIARAMPQRYPLLLIDRVVDLQPGTRVHAQKAISLNDYFYSRLPTTPRPSDYAYPVALLVEALAQAAGMLLRDSWAELRSDRHVVMFGSFAGIDSLSPAMPGDLLDIHAQLDAVQSDMAVISGRIVRGERAVLRADRISAALRPIANLGEH